VAHGSLRNRSRSVAEVFISTSPPITALLILGDLRIFFDAFVLPVDMTVLPELDEACVAAGHGLGGILRQMGGQGLLECCLLGLVGEVGVFMRVGLHVVELLGAVRVSNVAVG
jgi:hypothetical protein